MNLVEALGRALPANRLVVDPDEIFNPGKG
jgi:hypothetical protein